MDSSIFTNKQEALEAIAGMEINHKWIDRPQLVILSTGLFTFANLHTPIAFRIGPMGFSYIVYRLRNQNIDEIEGLEDYMSLRKQNVLDQVNKAIQMVFPQSAIAAMVGGELVALMDEYAPYTHEAVLEELYNIPDVQPDYIAIDSHKMVVSFSVTTIDDIQLSFRIHNGVAGTVSFGYRLYIGGSDGTWSVPAPKKVVTRHMNSHGASIDKAIANFKTVMQAASEEMFIKQLSNIMVDLEMIQTANDKEQTLIEKVASQFNSPIISLLELISTLNILSRVRGNKTAAVSIIKRTVKAVDI